MVLYDKLSMKIIIHKHTNREEYDGKDRSDKGMNRCWIRSVMEPPPSPNHWPNGPAVTATGTREPARSGDNASAANKRVHYNKAGAGITHIAKRRAWKAATAATKRAPQRGTHMGPQTSFPNKGSVGAARTVRGTW